MIGDFKVIDADGHILEPRDLWENYMDPKHRDGAPFMFRDADGKERLKIDGKIIGGARGLGLLDGIDAAFLYPSIGLFSGTIDDPELAAAMCRAYNTRPKS